MDEIKMRKNKFKSPEVNQRYLYSNTQRLNNFFLQNDNSDFYEDIIETNINNTNHFNNLKQISRYNNNNLKKNNLYNLDKEDDFSTNINNFFMNLNTNVSLMRTENITLKNNIKKYKKKLISKDKEIDNYKQKVRALLTQVQDKNYDIDIKRNTIIKLSEEKEMIHIKQMPTNNMNINNNNEILALKVQLQQLLKEKENYKKHIIYLRNLIQKMNRNNINQAKINNINANNNKNIESEKSSEYNSGNTNKKNSLNPNNKKNELQISSFIMQITGEKNTPILNKAKGNNNYKELLNKKALEFNQLNKEFEEYKKSKDLELSKIKKEIEEKNNLLKKREKTLNDYAINIKAVKDENINLKNNLNKRIVELNEYKLKYDDDKIIGIDDKKIEMDLIIRENKELKDRLDSIQEEKINSERKIEELNEDIENLKESAENQKKKLSEKNEVINKLNNEINNLKESQKNLEEENLNLKQSDEELKKELNNLQNKKNELTEEKNELTKQINTMEENIDNLKKELNECKALNAELKQKPKNNINVAEEEEERENNDDNKNEEMQEIKKENEVLQKRVIQLNDLIQDLNTQINELNVKYSSLKKENTNLKEASQAILNKQKEEMEERSKIENISPETHYIITKKTYNKLVWYLISVINPNNKTRSENCGYEHFKWVPGTSIPKSQLHKFNIFEDDEAKINDLYSYIKKMQTNLETKEEEINKKNYENQKLNNQLQNKSSNIKIGKLFLSKVLNNEKSTTNVNNNNKSNSNQNTLKNNANSYLGGNIGDVEKYKNLLDQINDYDEREKKLKNEIVKLNTQLKDKENLQSGMKDINAIPFDIDSIGDDLEDKKVIELIPNSNENKKKEKNKEKEDENFLNILNDVPGEDSDLDEVKGLKNLVKFLKKTIKEREKILNDLLKQIQEIIKDLKWSVKNNKIVTNILTILGYTPQVISIVTENKKGFNFDFNLELKK